MKEFKTESKQLLDLMINSIYADREVFLRELISNASDALDKVRLEDGGKAGGGGDLTIHVSFDREARTLRVSDTGIGMDEAALEECLGTIAHSGSRSVKDRLAREGADGDVDIIGQFGVGFYSSFMVADRVCVVSRASGSDRALRWDSNGVDGYVIGPAEREGRGTDVIVHLRPSTADENLERYLDQTSLASLIKRYSNYIRYPITMDLARETYNPEDGGLVRDDSAPIRTVINSMTPPWARDENEVAPDELDEFYRFEFRDARDPLHSMTVRARGAIEYDALLFIPQEAPVELYAKDFRYGLKLYSAGVLIDEQCADLVPSHFRFVRGIVDTKNVKLNVSREAVQEDGRVRIIARQIERSIVDNLKGMIEDDRAGYEAFFQAFGTGLKFAICQSQGTLSEALNGLLLYYSARNRHLVTLQEYLDAAGDEKGAEVLYAAGSDIDRMAKSPAVQAALERGLDVLLCPNGAQDEFCFMLMGAYKGAPFHSVASANLDLERDGEEAGDRQGAHERRERVLQAILEHAPQPLIRVVASTYLTRQGHAASHVSTEGLMTVSMAKYLTAKREKGQTPQPLYILEVNAGHALFALAEKAFERGDVEALGSCSSVLLGQALLAEDVPLEDPMAFNEAVNALLSFAAADE